MKYIKILLILLLVQQVSFGQAKKTGTVNCLECHETNIPTKDNPRLKKCPRDQMEIIHRSPSSGPKVLLLDDVKKSNKMYPAVRFSHQGHAEMADMSGSCQMCHHYNPVGPILACKECHSPERKRSDISKIDLEGAYHVRCMNCHRTFEQKVECNTCHKQNLKGNKSTSTKPVHPEMVKRPVVLTFETKYNSGKIVTFNHDEHITTFGLDCVKCHTDEGCAKCHSKNTVPAQTKQSLQDKHNKCSKCHDVKNNCQFCHADQKRGLFDHQTVAGWKLNRFHVKLSCDKCHTEKGKFSKLNTECSSCHTKWTQENFDHKITGLQLDENHQANECETCHVEKDFSKPVCTNCHENYKYPEKKPGKLIKN